MSDISAEEQPRPYEFKEVESVTYPDEPKNGKQANNKIKLTLWENAQKKTLITQTLLLGGAMYMYFGSRNEMPEELFQEIQTAEKSYNDLVSQISPEKVMELWKQREAGKNQDIRLDTTTLDEIKKYESLFKKAEPVIIQAFRRDKMGEELAKLRNRSLK